MEAQIGRNDNNNNDDDDDDDDNRIQRRNSRFFLKSAHCAANRLQHVGYAQMARAQSCANHVQHIERLSRSTCRATCYVARRDSSAIKFARAEIAFISVLFYWLSH